MKILLLANEKPEVYQIEQRYRDQICSIDKSIELHVPFASNIEEVHAYLPKTEALVGFPRDLEAISLRSAPQLKWMHSFSAGMERVLTPELKASNIMASNSSGVHAIPIAEHVLACILIFAKKFYQSFQNQQQKIWQPVEGMTEIRDSTLMVVGLGKIGKEIAKVANGTGMKVIAVDQALRQAQGKPEFVQEFYGVDELNRVLPQADYVVIALPYTQHTHHFFDMEKFRMMKKSSVLINIGRGGVIHEKELIEALQNGVIAGCALDVTQEEPLPSDSPLWRMNNVVITPHHSSRTKKRMDRTIDLLCEHIKAYLRGDRLPNLVDKEKGY